MRTGRPKSTLKLSADEERELTSLAHRSRSVPALARRARIMLACAEGEDNKTVARRLRATPATVGKWRGRFVQDRVARLYDEPRPGAPRTITDEHVEQVVVRMLESTPRGVTHLEHSRNGQGHRAQSHDHQPHLARLWIAAAPHGDFQAVSRPAAGAEGA